MFHLTRVHRNFVLVQDSRTSSVALYSSNEIHRLMLGAARCLALDDWDHIQRLLLAAPLDA